MPSSAMPCGATASRSSPSKTHAPGRRLVDAADDVEHRRLAGAVGSDEPADLTFVDGERQPVEGDDAAEPDGDVLHVEQCHVCVAPFPTMLLGGTVARLDVAPSAHPLAHCARGRRARPRRRDRRRDDDVDDDDVVVLSWWQHPANVIALVVAVAADRRDDRLADRRRRRPPTTAATVDIGFLQDMRIHHEQAVQMAFIYLDLARHRPRPAHGRPQHPHRPEHRHRPDDPDAARHGCAGGRRDRRGDGLDGHADDRTTRCPAWRPRTQLDELAASSGADADQLFVELMVAHHQGGLHMAEFAAAEAENAEVRSLAAVDRRRPAAARSSSCEDRLADVASRERLE